MKLQVGGVNGTTMSSQPFRLNFIHQVEDRGDGLDHTSTRELLARWKADIREIAISDDLAPAPSGTHAFKRGTRGSATGGSFGSRSPYLSSTER
jgi:hypothetical protein